MFRIGQPKGSILEGFPMNVEEVQRRLWEQSTRHKELRQSGTPLFPVNRYDGRIRNLMDLMHQPDWLQEACNRVLVRSRGKAPGVDGVTAHQYPRGTPMANLKQYAASLKHGNLPAIIPVRRVMDTKVQR
jgi:hypothetical protein